MKIDQGSHRSEGERTEHQQSERAVTQHVADLRREGTPVGFRHFAGAFFADRHESCSSGGHCLRRFSDDVEVVDPELTTDRTARRKPPDVQLLPVCNRGRS